MKIGVLVVAYNAERTLATVLNRIPPPIRVRLAEVLVQDDHSADDTHGVAMGYAATSEALPITAIRHANNLGYGGNQKAGYRYAIDHGWDVVVLLHGDGQYAPEVMHEVVAPIVDGDADAVFGSRMLHRGQARAGGMPLYKFVGNRVLTRFQNATSGLALSEWHSGYRAYRTAALADIPFDLNSDGFDFDTEIILQLHSAGKRIAEVPIPTYYGDEICYVNGVRYARDVVRHSVRHRLGASGFGAGALARVEEPYAFKPSATSSHGRVLQLLAARPPQRVLDVGCGPGWLAAALTEQGHEVTGVDAAAAEGVEGRMHHFVRADLDRGLPDGVGEGFDVVVAADVLEHLREPPRLLTSMVDRLRQGGSIIASVPNVSHWYPRGRVAIGRFDYDQRGILDATHLRFFTRRSFLRMARACGLEPVGHAHTGLPFDALTSDGGPAVQAVAGVDRTLVRAWPTMFAYQFVFELVARGDGEPVDVTTDRSMWRRRAAGTADRPGELGDADRRRARWVTIAGTVLFLLVVCQWRPWDLFDRAGFSADFYDAQAHAFLGLHLDVPAAIPGPEGFLIDGRTYLYYGPFLALVRLPIAVLGHWADGRFVRLSMTVGYAALCTATYHLVAQAARCWVPRVDTRAPRRRTRPATVVVAAMAVSPALFLSGWVSVYHETEMWAAVFAVAAAAQVLALWRAPTRRTLLLAAAFALAALLTRATVGIGAFVGLAGVGLLLWRRARPLAIGAVSAAVLGALVHVGLNAAKFGTPFDLPADRQLLTLQDPTRAAWFAGNGGSFFSTRFLPTTVVQYLRPDTIRFERLLPMVRYGPLAHEYGSYPLETNTPSASLTAAATVLFVLAVVGVVVLVRRRMWAPLVVLAGLVVAAIPSFLIGFTANRYLVDMLPALALPAAFAAVAFIPPARRWLRHLAVGAVIAGIIWGAWVNVALATWTQQLKSPGFTAWRYGIDDALFGGTPPSVVRLHPGAAVARDGVVGIDGDCAGVYIAEQGRWVVLELGADRGVRGTFTPDLDATVVDGDAGALTLVTDPAAETAQVRWLPAGGEPLDGPLLDWDGGPLAVDVVADPVGGGFVVTVDGDLGLLAGEPPDLGMMTPGPAFAVRPATTPLCDDLAARLG